MTKGDLLRVGLTTSYSLLSIKIMQILSSKMKDRQVKRSFPLSERDRKTLKRGKILVDKMVTWTRYIKDLVEENEIKTEKEGYLDEGMALIDIVLGDHPKTDTWGGKLLEIKFFEDVSQSLWLLIGDYSFDDLELLRKLYVFFERFQEKLSSINNAERYGVRIP